MQLPSGGYRSWYCWRLTDTSPTHDRGTCAKEQPACVVFSSRDTIVEKRVQGYLKISLNDFIAVNRLVCVVAPSFLLFQVFIFSGVAYESVEVKLARHKCENVWLA